MLKALTFLIALTAIGYYYFFQRPGASLTRKPAELRDAYDYIIAGGGTAGSVLAARLTEDPSINVLVLEAGGEEDHVWLSHIPGLLNDLQLTNFDWQYLTEPQKHCCSALKNRQIRWPRGKALGGSSSHNWMNYVRCSPLDYDHWANDLNNTGWSYKDVLPYFKKIETNEIDHLKGNDYHGYQGPLNINLGFRTPLGESVRDSLKKEGYSFKDDYNGKTYEGFNWVQFNINKKGRRMSVAKGYLRPNMGRPNLHVVINAHVSKIIIDEKKPKSLVATGVEYFYEGRTHIAKARKEVIVSGGAINSPQLLLLSGIGPKKQLDQFGVRVLVDNPAVGLNLDDHIASFLTYKANASGRTDGHNVGSWPGYLKALSQWYLFGTGPFSKSVAEITGWVRTGLLPGDWPDIQLYFTNPYPFFDEVIGLTPEATERRAIKGEDKDISLGFGVIHNHPVSKGSVRLRTTDPLAHPIIDYHYFEDQVDVDVMVKGLRTWVDLINKSPHLKQFDVQFGESGPVPGCEKHALLSDEFLKCFVRSRSVTLYHPVGTCRMGKKGENSVVDTELRVHGVDGLRVVDASVFPEHLSGNTHAPTIMVAEKASDLIKAAQKH